MKKKINQMTNSKATEPDLTTELAKTPLIPEADFHKKLKAIFSMPKTELDQHIKDHPDPPQKRGRKPKRL
jgi:hypothetical protein